MGGILRFVKKTANILCVLTSIGAVRLSANNALYGHSVDNVASHYEDERLSDSIEELEAQIIGNLLPNDDDLLSGMCDDHGLITQGSTGDDMDEVDLFSSVGGMELGEDDNSSSRQKNSEIFGGAFNSKLGLCNSSIAGEHPTRTLFARNINSFQTSQSGNSKTWYSSVTLRYLCFQLCFSSAYVILFFFLLLSHCNIIQILPEN